MKLPTDVAIRAAIERVAASGKVPSYATVNVVLLGTRGRGASRRDVLPLLRQWRDDQLAACSGAVEAAAAAVVALPHDVARDEVRRLVAERTGNKLRVRFFSAARFTGGGNSKVAKLRRLAAAGHTPVTR